MVQLVLIGPQMDAPTVLPPNTLVFNSWSHNAVMHAWKRSLFGIAAVALVEAVRHRHDGSYSLR